MPMTTEEIVQYSLAAALVAGLIVVLMADVQAEAEADRTVADAKAGLLRAQADAARAGAEDTTDLDDKS